MRILIVSILTLCLLIICSSNVYSKSVTLEWDQNDDADYYVVYMGYVSQHYTEWSGDIRIPLTQYTYVDSNESDDVRYYAVKAFNSCGNSSDFSDEVEYQSYTPPPMPSPLTKCKILYGVIN